MKGNITLAILISFLLPFTAISQNNYYYHSPKGKEVLQLSTQKIIIKFLEGVDVEQQQLILGTERHIAPLKSSMQLPAPKVVFADLQNTPTAAQVWDLLQHLNQHPQVAYANPVFVYGDGTLQAVQESLILRLKSPSDYTLLKNTALFHRLNIIAQNEFDAQIYHLATNKNTHANALTVANELYETGIFEYVEPDFLRFMKKMTTNDPAIDNQWSLNNTGQNNGTPGADMNIFDAWMNHTGSTSVKVAIIDEGVDLQHPDLIANLETGYDATGQGSAGAPSGNDAHGTACAGIAAAVGNNGLGMAGVAYGSKIIPIRIAYSNGDVWVTSNAWIGNAINWAWQNAGADVLSNSWGGGGASFTIDASINNAVSNGRNGLGAPVLFAAGNNNAAVDYPATNDNTIAVAAMSMCYERKSPSSCDGQTWWGSNFGADVDVAAPGVKIYATDISGSAGYSTGDYITGFNGTSSATPNAAGVMALILSANESLTEQQARFALESTCEKVGNYSYTNASSGQPNGSWSNELGYGKINAVAAISSVIPSRIDDAGIMNIVSPKDEAICANTIAPVVTLRNNGANNLTSVTISYQIDNANQYTYLWTGNLSSTQNTQVTLPHIPVNDGVHILNVSTSLPNGQTDTNSANNGAAATFSSGSNEITLRLILDNYGTETTWKVKDANGNVLQEGGPYQDNAVGSEIRENICLPAGCFNFIIYDAYGDGMCCGYGNGSYRLTNNVNGAALASGGQYGSQELTNFCLEGAPIPPLTVNITNTTHVTCHGDQNGSASGTAQGGVSPYTFHWNHGGNEPSATGLSAGTYILKVIDAQGQIATVNVTIHQPSILNLTMLQSNAVNGNTGYAAVEVDGGTQPYTYRWSNGATTPGISGLSGGTYAVTVTDAHHCIKLGSVVVEEMNSSPLNVNITAHNNVSCNGGQNGAATAQASGGVPPYSFNWNNGQGTATATGLAAGYAVVAVIDSEGNQASAQVTITQPSAINASIAATEAVNGNNGSADLTVLGGTAPYTYNWSNGANTQDINHLAGGNYSVVIRDANGCEKTVTVFIEEINTPALTVNITNHSNVSCNGGQNGTATAQASGGFPPYSFTWNNGQSTTTATGLAAGLVSVVVTDGEGHQASAQVMITQPTILSLTLNKTDAANGNNGTIHSSVAGGTMPYTYAWSNGASSATLTNLAVGTYHLTVTDANGCFKIASTNIEDVTPEVESALTFEHGLLTGIGEHWETISLENNYTSMVVVASVRMPNANAQPVVARVRNANGNRFDLRIQIPGGSTNQVFEVDYMVIEEGVYTIEEHGVKMEAVKANSTKTANATSWVRETRTYQNQYTNPVVLGQVMTNNNQAWSIFWASSSSSRSTAPTANSFAAGKNVAEDINKNRVNETIGYLVIEAGKGNINGLNFQAGLSADVVMGLPNTNGEGIAQEISGLVGATVAIVSTAAIDGSNGGWPSLLNENPVDHRRINLTFDEDQIKDDERSHTTEQAAFIVFEDLDAQPAAFAEIAFEEGIVKNVGNQWVTIELTHEYSAMVVVATVVLTSANDTPVVTRIQNASGNSFQLKVQSTGNSNDVNTAYSVHYMVIEEGFYTEMEHGVTMEAFRFNSTQTSARNIWKYEYQTYQNQYTQPVVLGQVMTYNDNDWSVFWSNNGYRKNPATATTLAIGKHVGEDSDKTRSNETLGYIVMESGVGNINGLEFIAGVGADILLGIGGTNGTNVQYNVEGATAGNTAILSAAGIDGADCGWPILYGENPVQDGKLFLAYDEDQMSDLERAHTTEQASYVLFNSFNANSNFTANTVQQLGSNDTPTTYLSVYPNPTTDVINLQHDFTASGAAQIIISDMMGRKVMQENIFIEKEALHHFQLDVRHLEAGHYFVTILSDDEPTTEQFIKTK